MAQKKLAKTNRVVSRPVARIGISSLEYLRGSTLMNCATSAGLSCPDRGLTSHSSRSFFPLQPDQADVSPCISTLHPAAGIIGNAVMMDRQTGYFPR
jgi:hypothetical protein